MARDRLASLRSQGQGPNPSGRWSYPSLATDFNRGGNLKAPPAAYIQLQHHSGGYEGSESECPSYPGSTLKNSLFLEIDTSDPFADGYGLYAPPSHSTRVDKKSDAMSVKSLDNMSQFYEEISSIQDSLKTFNDNVSRISGLHSRSLNSMDWATARRSVHQVESLMKDTSRLAENIKLRVKDLYAIPATGRERDIQSRMQQSAMIKHKFVEAVHNYQQVEQLYRGKYKQRLERQFLVVKPDATPEEVKEVVDGEHDDQLFSKILQSSSRYGDSRAAFREVKERHDDIKKIEETLTQLSEIFSEMEILIMKGGEKIEGIHTITEDVEKHAATGLQQTTKAVKSARAVRKKYCLCFALCALLLLFFAVSATFLTVALTNGNNN